MICGYCGREAGVAERCPFCKADLTAKRTAHWEGGKGCRDKSSMSRKDTKKYGGVSKTVSNKKSKREFMQKRGNQSKRSGDKY